MFSERHFLRRMFLTLPLSGSTEILRFFYCFIIILLLEAVVWVRKRKMKNSVCFMLRKRSCPCWITHFGNIKGKCFLVFNLCKALVLDVGVPLHIKMKFESLRMCCKVRHSGVSRVLLRLLEHPFENALSAGKTQRIISQGLYWATTEHDQRRKS